jgi:hypothetical protein
MISLIAFGYPHDHTFNPNESETRRMTDYTKIEAYGPLRLREGSGGSWDNGLCVMETVHWLSGAKDAGETPTDSPDCACPVLGAFAIWLNDNLNDENRQKLLPLALPLTGTRSPEHEQARVEFLVMAVINRILPQVFERRWPEHAKAMMEAKTLKKAKAVCLKAKNSAYAADADAYAVAYAAYAAAACGAYGAYAVDAAAAYAVDAVDAAAAAADDARQSILLQCIPILKEAIELGPNAGDQWPQFESRARELGEYVGAAT